MVTFLSSFNMSTVFLIIIIGVLLAVLIYWNNQNKSGIDLKMAMLNDDNKFSLSRFGQLVALIVSTWVLIHETQTGKLTDWLFTGYMISWAGANIASKYLERSYRADKGYRLDQSDKGYSTYKIDDKYNSRHDNQGGDETSKPRDYRDYRK